MFLFQTIGKITGMNTSGDGRTAYLKVLADPQTGIDIHKDETPGVLDVHAPLDLLPQGVGLGTRIAIEGTGANTERSWTKAGDPTARPKIITNLRMQARSIKLAK